MGWTLEIHTIDVGQGESSLIVARFDGVIQRTILIDAGLQACAGIVHEYVSKILNPTNATPAPKAVDTIVVSHYDKDHSGGVVGLLGAEILWEIADIIGVTVAEAHNQLPDDTDPGVRGVAYAAAAWLAMYGLEGELPVVLPDILRDKAQLTGCTNPRQAAGDYVNWIRGGTGARIKKDVLCTAVLAAADTAARSQVFTGVPHNAQVTQMTDAVRAAVVDELWFEGDPNAMFDANGLYENVVIIDLGGAGKPARYKSVVLDGSCLLGTSGKVAQRPRGGFTRLTAGLSHELLWYAGHPGIPAPGPAGDPCVYVVAANGYVWGSPEKIPSEDENSVSIALLVVFNQFYFFTAGDLPSDVEEAIAVNLRNPPGGRSTWFAPIPGVAGLKVSHHGSKDSTSEDFLKMLNPAVAIISCGPNRQYGHPTRPVISRLADTVVAGFFTNVPFAEADVPASRGYDQLDDPETYFYVAGDSNPMNLKKSRVRGDLVLCVDEAASTLGPGEERRSMTIRFRDTTGSRGTRRGDEKVRF